MASKWAGRNASVSYGAVLYNFKKWTLSVERTRIDVTDFLSTTGWREFLNGFRSGSVSLEGPLSTDAARIDDDAGVTVILGIGGGNQITFTGIVTKNGYSQDIDDCARYSVEIAITGAPTFTLGL